MKTKKPMVLVVAGLNGSGKSTVTEYFDLESEENFQRYIDTLMPCAYDDLIDMAKEVLDNEHRRKLHILLDCKFKKHSRYNLSARRLELIDNQVHKRAAELLK